MLRKIKGSVFLCMVVSIAQAAQKEPRPEFVSRAILHLGTPSEKVMNFPEPTQRRPLPAIIELSTQGYTVKFPTIITTQQQEYTWWANNNTQKLSCKSDSCKDRKHKHSVQCDVHYYNVAVPHETFKPIKDPRIGVWSKVKHYFGYQETQKAKKTLENSTRTIAEEELISIRTLNASTEPVYWFKQSEHSDPVAYEWLDKGILIEEATESFRKQYTDRCSQNFRAAFKDRLLPYMEASLQPRESTDISPEQIGVFPWSDGSLVNVFRTHNAVTGQEIITIDRYKKAGTYEKKQEKFLQRRRVLKVAAAVGVGVFGAGVLAGYLLKASPKFLVHKN